MKRVFQSPRSVVVAQAMFFVNAAIWLAFGIASLLRLARGAPGPMVTPLVVAVLMFGNAGVMLVAGVGLGQRRKLLYYFGVAVLVVNIILTVTDEFGLFDFITLVIDLALLGLLIVTHSQYVSTGPEPPGGVARPG